MNAPGPSFCAWAKARSRSASAVVMDMMTPVTEIEAEGEPAGNNHGGRGSGGNDGRSSVIFRRQRI
jgi:hypothetical protein